MNPSPVIAVTGLHRGENPQPGSAVIRSLRRVYPELRIIGLCYDTLESGLFCEGDAPDAAFVLPSPAAGPDSFWDRLDAIRELERFDVLIPCLDAEMAPLVEAADKLQSRGIHTCLPRPGSFRTREKARLTELCARVRCRTPQTIAVNDVGALHQAAAMLGGNVFVKGRLYDARLATTAEEREAAYRQMMEQWGAPVLVQERIEGEEYNVLGLGDGHGRIVASCSIRKMLRTSSGKGCGGLVVRDERLDDIAASLIASLRWNGPFELEFVSPEGPGGDYSLLEINPRFPAWCDFPSSLGCNLPAAALEQTLGWRPREPLQPCSPGRFFIRHAIDMTGDIRDLAALTTTGRLLRTPPAIQP
ncbi:MAG: ATP-grasp domain-containing protein [Prosthecobacter sp.]